VVRKASDEKCWTCMWLGEEVIKRIFIEHEDSKAGDVTEIVK
jgi:hypothetical protein